MDLMQLRRQRQQQNKKKIGFMTKTTALHLYHAFWYMSLTSTARPRRETPKATLYGGCGHMTTNFPFSISAWLNPFRIQLQEKSPTFNKLSSSKELQ